jgi:hypothetical protein
VRIGDGCATVTERKLPMPLSGIANRTGRRERGKSEARIPVELCSSAPPLSGRALLRKEKDEASLSNSFRQDSLNAFIPRFAGV